MKTLTQQFEEILMDSILVPDSIYKLFKAIRERDLYIIGEDEALFYPGSTTWKKPAKYQHRNELRAEQRQRAEETL